MQKDLLTLLDLTRNDFQILFTRAFELKKRRQKGISDRPLMGKTLGLIFEKPSTRTRVSFESAVIQLGGTPIYLSTRDTQLSRKEPVKDTARVLSRYLEGLVIRTFSQSFIEEFAEASDIPIFNALTDMYHPCQVLSDLMTVIEVKGGYEGIKIAWVGDGNNVANSWISSAAVLNLNLAIACPKGYFPDEKIMEKARKTGEGRLDLCEDPMEAVKDADIIYTDVWASMGQEEEQASRLKIFQNFQVNAKLVAQAKKNVSVMHCLPAHRGEEITEEVLEGPQSIVWDQAENKLHMHKAILETLMTRT